MSSDETRKLGELAKTIRSKNAGVNKITFDIVFQDRGTYELVQALAGASPRSVAALYRIPPDRIRLRRVRPRPAIKFTIYRSRPSGSAGDGDIFGAQQYGPLLDLEVPG